jgi:hypothetical protein
MGQIRNAYNILVGKPEGKRPLEITGRRCKDDIRTDLRETGWEMRTGCILLKIGTNGGLL